jgi:hypothetical protein
VPNPAIQPSQPDHPTWCVRGHCEAALGGNHSSRPAVIRPQLFWPVRVQVRTWRPATPDTFPVLIELIVTDVLKGQTVRVDLNVSQAARLALVLDTAVPA